MNSILYVFLPCKKVYPIGVTYLADFIHRRRPDVRQRVLDLSLYPQAQRARVLTETASAFAPELVCFSWRDIQIFSPHEGDASLEHAFNFYFAGNPLKRVVASFQGLKQLYRYYRDIRVNLSYPWLIRKECPQAQLMIGGGAFTAFADQLIEKLPDGTIGILGEGEDAILKVLQGQALEDERYIYREGGRIQKGEKHATTLLVYRRPIHHRQGGLSAVHRDSGTHPRRAPGHRMVGLHPDLPDHRRTGHTDGPVRRRRSGGGDHVRVPGGAQQPPHGLQAGPPLRRLSLPGRGGIPGQGHPQLLTELPERNRGDAPGGRRVL